MPREILQSAGHACRGFLRAFRMERNLQLFGVGYVIVLLLGVRLGLQAWEWVTLLLSGGMFFAVELFNTALECFADGFDDHVKCEHRSECYATIRATKDIAAAASLVSFIVAVMVISVVFWAHFSPTP